MSKVKLSIEPSRMYSLTDRECANVLGCLIGGLATMNDPTVVRRAVRWWADSDEAWRVFDRQREQLAALAKARMEED